MSAEELQLLTIRLEARNKLAQTLLSGVKDLLVVVASVATLYIQVTMSSKLDLAAKSAATSEVINTTWLAQRTGEPQAQAKAAEAIERYEKASKDMP